MCTRPTCRGILGDVIRKKKYFPAGSDQFLNIGVFLKKYNCSL